MNQSHPSVEEAKAMIIIRAKFGRGLRMQECAEDDLRRSAQGHDRE
jgi:hypothetical protein